MSQFTDAQICQMINRYIRKKLDFWDNTRFDGRLSPPFEIQEDLEQLEELISDCAFELRENQLGSAGSIIRKILEEEQAPLPLEDTEFNKICREYLKSAKKMYQVERNRTNGHYDDDIEKMFHVGSLRNPEPPPLTQSAPLSQIMDEYIKMKGGGWKPRTKTSYGPIINRFLEYFGKGHDVRMIQHSDMVKFRDDLQEKGYKGNPLSIKSVNTYLAFYCGLFNYATPTYNLPRNPTLKLTLSDKRRPDEIRAPFDMDDLNKLFCSDKYTKDSHKHPHTFWIPLLALYTGARLEEICQLYVEDIKIENGVWVLDINETESDKSVKTSERRLVPIHPFIAGDLHFIDFVKNLQDQKGRLFPELKRINDRYGHSVTNWFARYKKRCGLKVDKEKKVFHSFRHTVVDHLLQKDVPDNQIAMLVGHTIPGMTAGRYGKRFNSKKLLESVVLKIDYGIDLSHLKNSKYVIKG